MRRLLSPRRALVGAFTLAAVAADLWFAPVAASAAPAHVTCTGQEAVNYSPGLTFTPHDTTVTINGFLGSAGNPGLCVAPGEGITSATYTEVFNRPGASCVQALFDGPGSRVIVWSDGHSSTFTFTAQIQTLPAASLVTLTGTITSGEFAGRRAVETIQIPQLDLLQCLTTGIDNSIALATLIIL
ncbi:MAG: hypothetical protein ACQSGP_23660 [Frankia sp.]